MADMHENGSVSRVNDKDTNQNDDKEKEKKDSGSDSSSDDKKKKKEKSGGSSESGKSDKKDEDGKKGGKGGKDDKDGESKKMSKAEERMEQKKQLMQKLQKISAANQVAGTGIKFMLQAKLMSMLKMMMQMMMALVQSAAQMGLGAFLMMFAQAALQAIGNAIVAFAGFIGTTVTSLVTGIVTIVAVLVVAVVGVLSDMAAQPAQRDDLYDCNTDKSFMYTASVNAAAEELETAKTVYAILKAYGLADTNIAGVLGNWSCESGVDPTGVETIYTEPRLVPDQVTAPKKWEAWYGTYLKPYDNPHTGMIEWGETSPANFMLSSPDPVYGNKFGLRTYVGSILSQSVLLNYSNKYPGIHYMGIGLGQWTNGRNLQLRSYADAHDGYEWYDLELQLLFMLDPNGGDYIEYINRLAGWEEEPTPSSAAEWFCEHWEGITMQPERATRAEEWYVTMGTWVEGVDYDLASAQTLLGSIMSAGVAGGNRKGSGALRNCSGYVLSANDSAVNAILAYAWGPGEAYNNDGTECWKQIFGAIIGDEHIRCCDRTVCAAIRWSGTDSDYPVGGTGVQLTYLLASPRWQKIDWGGDPSKLLPGDVLIRNDGVINGVQGVGHTLMYVGVDAIVAKFGETYNGQNVREQGYCCVSGSIDMYSPHVQRFTTTGTGANNLTTYYVFRNVEKFSDRSDWTSLTCVSGTPPA